MNDTRQDHQQSDEIDLRHVVYILYKERWVLATTLVFCLALSLGYLFVTPKAYTTELTFRHVPEGMRDYNKVPGLSYSETEAALEFSHRLASYVNFVAFIEASNYTMEDLTAQQLPSSESELSDLYRTVYAQFRFTPPGERNMAGKVQFTYAQGMPGPDFLNAYYLWSLETYIKELVERAGRVVNASIRQNERHMDALMASYREETQSQVIRLTESRQVRIQQLQDRLESEKNALIAKREERIRLLREAEQIAEQLGITQPTTPRDLGRQQGERDIIYAEINSQSGLPLYFMGTEALRTERQVLEQNLYEEVRTKEIREIEKEIQTLQHNREIEAMLAREVESPFIEGYHRLQEQNLMLKAAQLTSADINVAEILQWAYQPSHTDSPRASLVIAIALIGGLFAGMMVAFMVHFFRSFNAYRKTTPA